MKGLLTFLILVWMLKPAAAQQTKPRFNSVTSVGLAAGEKTNAPALETINGIRFSDWFAGIGVGIDYYRYKTLPLFGNVKWYFDSVKKAFLYGSAGYNFPLKNKPGPEIWYFDDYSFSGGIYLDAGIGYALPLGKRSAVVLSAGYSYKALRSTTIIHVCPFIPPCYEDKTRLEFTYGRIMLKAGVSF